ncbi:MAG: class I SAM-dependent methyltransferase [Actinomycetota bacterium]|nr:class I SAM-dependent methyltransferase [Actinomycetota bacterium]
MSGDLEFGQRDRDPSAEVAPCPLCGEEAPFEAVYRDCHDVLHWGPGTYSVVRCCTCQLVRTSPRPHVSALGEFYPSQYYDHAAPEERELNGAGRVIKAALRAPYHRRYGSSVDLDPPDRPGRRFLDIGCGTGVRLARAARLGWEAWGVEPTAAAVAVARSRPEISEDRLVMATLDDALLPEGTFDLATMSHVLEHVPDPVATVALLRRLLGPDGRIRMWVPDFASLERRMFRRSWLGLDVPRHLFHFTPATLTDLLHRGGFEVERLVPHFQASSLSGSLQLWQRRARRSRGDYRHSPVAYHMCLPPAAVLCALGHSGVIDVTARRVDDRTRADL